MIFQNCPLKSSKHIIIFTYIVCPIQNLAKCKSNNIVAHIVTFSNIANLSWKYFCLSLVVNTLL